MLFNDEIVNYVTIQTNKNGKRLFLKNDKKIIFENWYKYHSDGLIFNLFEEDTIWKKENVTVNNIFYCFSHGIGDIILYSLFLENFMNDYLNSHIHLIIPPSLIRFFKSQKKFSNITFYSSKNIEEDHSILINLCEKNNHSIHSLASLMYVYYQPSNNHNFTPYRVATQKNIFTNKPIKVIVNWKAKEVYYSKRRDLPLECLWHLQSFKSKVQFVVMAHGVDKTERDEVVDMLDAIDVGDDIHDFQDAANYIGECDLLISVETAYLHLAGAMGKEVWGLIRYDHDWRWERYSDGNEWYPTLRRFNQLISRDWTDIMQDVKYALGEWLEQKETEQANIE